MYTIATAGHIDHGKSSLVRALTGIDPDRLPEEKARQMTIELGFAHFRLSDGREVGIIDVPGHERFIKTMISGVGALDLVLFVVAADDGWMPQSEEHLAILRHLGVERGLIVLTKVDLVGAEWAQLVKSDLREKTKDTFLAGSPIVEFSAIDNRNLVELRSAIEAALHALPARLPAASARLFVDRIFSVAGTGTVVTGTLREGRLSVGQSVLVHPGGAGTRVKSLESFYSKLDQAEPGIRLAVGLQSLEKIEVARGDVVYYPADLAAGDMIGVKIICEANTRRFVKQGRTITLLHGTSEIEGSLQMAPDEAADSDQFVAVLRLDRSSIFKTGDRFVLRLTTPSRLIGGGLIIDPQLKNFSRRDPMMWSRLRSAATLEPRAMIIYELEKDLISRRGQLLSQSGFVRREIEAAVGLLLKEKAIIEFDGELILQTKWQEAEAAVLGHLKEFHAANPHQATLPLAELRSRVSLPEVLVDLVLGELVKAGKVLRRDSGIKLAASASGLSAEQERVRNKIVSLLGESTASCLARTELFSLDKEARNVYTYLRQNDLIVDANGTVYLKTTFEETTNLILGRIRANGRITVAEARDLTGSSRKFVLPVLEDLDRRRITRREGDFRVLWQ